MCPDSDQKRHERALQKARADLERLRTEDPDAFEAHMAKYRAGWAVEEAAQVAANQREDRRNLIGGIVAIIAIIGGVIAYVTSDAGDCERGVAEVNESRNFPLTTDLCERDDWQQELDSITSFDR